MREFFAFVSPALLFMALVLVIWYASIGPHHVPQSRPCPICGQEAKLTNYSGAYSSASYWCKDRHYSSFEYHLGFWRIRYLD